MGFDESTYKELYLWKTKEKKQGIIFTDNIWIFLFHVNLNRAFNKDENMAHKSKCLSIRINA